MSSCMQVLKYAALSGYVVQGNMRTLLISNAVSQDPVIARLSKIHKVASPLTTIGTIKASMYALGKYQPSLLEPCLSNPTSYDEI